MTSTKEHPNTDSIKELLAKRCGFMFEGVRSMALEEGIRQRMSLGGLEDMAEYLRLLLKDAGEFRALVNALTVNETYFFREPAHINLFVERLAPGLLKRKKNGEKIRILSAGCATGEEPYSIAMALMEKYGPDMHRIFKIIAVDIDTETLAKAEKGVFGKRSFRKFDRRLLEKYFRKSGLSGYELIEAVREKVDFHIFNLQGEHYPARLSGMDAIFYRNVSIYFTPDNQSRIFGNLAGILNDGGYIVVSSIETYMHNKGILPLLEMDGHFLYCKSPVEEPVRLRQHRRPIHARGNEKAPSKEVPVRLRRHRRPGHAHGEEKPPSKEELFDEALQMARSKRHEDALLSIDRLIEAYPSYIDAYALKASVLINMGRMPEAERHCLEALKKDRWHLESHLLLGLVARAGKNYEEALRRFKESVYLKPSCWLAHFYLAEAYHKQGDMRLAGREYGVVIKLLEKGNFPDTGLAFYPLSFSSGQVAHMCRHKIEILGGRG